MPNHTHRLFNLVPVHGTKREARGVFPTFRCANCIHLLLLIAFLMLRCVSPGVAQDRPAHFVPLASSTTQARYADSIDAINREIEAAIASGQTPGCALIIGHNSEIILEAAYGDRQIEPTREPMTVDTVFDLASLTKPIATATSVMQLIESGAMQLDRPLADYLPGFEQNGKAAITVEQLLTHQGGLIPDNALRDYLDGRELAMERMLALSPIYEPGSRFAYTDVGFIALAEAVAAISEQDIAAYSKARIFAPLGMSDTGYLPNERDGNGPPRLSSEVAHG